MPAYRVTLMENLPANPPATLDVRYTYNNGNPTSTWQVTAVVPNPAINTNVVTVTIPVNLNNIPSGTVATRRLVGHYPVAPNTREFVISSVLSSAPPGATSGVGETPYRVTVTMDDATVKGLADGGYQLYGFKAVKAAGKGAPLVWFKTSDFSDSTSVLWTEKYQAYTSHSELIPHGQITASSSHDIELGQTLNVTSAQGTGTVVEDGTPGAIDIRNETTTPFTCGISQQSDGSITPICAFPLHGGGLDLIAPIEKILLTFSSLPVNTGVVIEQAYSPGILIDLTGETSRAVRYDIDKGWDWGHAAWATPVQASDSLVPLLIETSESLARRYLASRHLS